MRPNNCLILSLFLIKQQHVARIGYIILISKIVMIFCFQEELFKLFGKKFTIIFINYLFTIYF